MGARGPLGSDECKAEFFLAGDMDPAARGSNAAAEAEMGPKGKERRSKGFQHSFWFSGGEEWWFFRFCGDFLSILPFMDNESKRKAERG